MTNIYTPSTTKYRFYSIPSKATPTNREIRSSIARKISVQCTKSILYTVKRMSQDLSTLAEDAASKGRK